MPSRRVSASVANGKKTLSDSEVLAYSKNRFVEHNLRQRVQHLSDQEQVCQDRLQKEMVRWRHFIRQSSRTTGVWSESLGSEGDPWSETEDPQEGRPQGEEAAAPAQRAPPPRTNPSTELARSLTFQSEALSQLQKPWVYTYSELSHNTIYKNALEAAKVKAKRLLFKRAASAPGNRLTSDPPKASQAASCRTPVTPSRAGHRGRGGRGDTRPLTGRSTPGLPLKSARASPSKLTASAAAAINTNRPQTSVGVVTNRPQKVAWTDKDKSPENSPRLSNISPHMARMELESPDSDHVQDTTPSQHVTTVFKFTDNGHSVEMSPTKEKKPNEVKLPAVRRRKLGIVLNMEELSTGNVTKDSFAGSAEDIDNDDVFPNEIHERLTRNTKERGNQQMNGEPAKQQENDAHSPDATTGERNTSQTGDDSSSSGQGEDSTRLQNSLAVWKRKDMAETPNSPQSSEANGSVSQPLITPPEKEAAGTSSDVGLAQVHVTYPLLPAMLKLTSPPHHQPEVPAESQAGKNQASENKNENGKSENQEGKNSKAENHEDGGPVSEAPEDRDSKPNPQVTSTSRPPDSKGRSPGSGQRSNGSSESPLAGIHSVPLAHSAFKRRGSFMRIVEQLEAMRASNRRRSVRVDEDTTTTTPPDDRDTATKPDNESPKTAAQNNTPTLERDAKTKARHKYAKIATTVAVLRSCPESQTENQPPSQQTDKTGEAPQTDKPTPRDRVSQVTEVRTLALEDSTHKPLPAERHTENSPRSGSDTDLPLYTSDVRSLAGSDFTTFKGYRIRNYVRPQRRYRADPFINDRREKSLVRLSIEYPVYLNGYRGDLKSQMLFPKTCRQKVLQELVQRNHQPPPVQETGVVPPELKAKIDEFCRTIEDYCPAKPEIILDQ